jgi:bla regulator protein BlaR1
MFYICRKREVISIGFLKYKINIKGRVIIMISNLKKVSFKGIAVTAAIITAIGFTTLSSNPKQVLATDNNESEISQSQTTFLQNDMESTVKLWAQALGLRNGAFRYALLSDDLKQAEYEKYNEMNWVIGGSSPWVVSYTINENNKIDDETYEYEIEYTMTDSTKTAYNSHENITVQKMGSKWFVINHDDYGYLPDVTQSDEPKFSEVPQRLLENPLSTDDKQGTVNLWAEALKQRSGAFRFAILSNDLKKAEYDKYSEMKWTIGGSSPKVVSYKINENNKIDDKTYEYEIEYTMTDSTNTIYTSRENITIKQNGRNWKVINHDNYDYLPEIIK